MKNIFYACISMLFLFSCSVDTNELNEQEENLTQTIEKNLNRGMYYGMFTTLNSKYRAKVKINIPKVFLNDYTKVSKQQIPYARVDLQNGETVFAKAITLPEEKTAISNLLFKGENISFLFSVDNNGSNPTISSAKYKSLDADILVIKTNRPPKTITGTYECLDCGTHPSLGEGKQQTFNIMFPDGGTGNENNITTQLNLGDNVFVSNTGNSQSNCDANNGKNNCDITGTSVNGNVTWTGNHIYRDDASCSSVTGTWDFDSNYGLLSGTFVSDDATCRQTIFSEDFNSFQAAGFTPSPAAGQLDSNIYKVTGFNDGDSDYGDTNTSGDLARGSSVGGVSTGGIYAFETSTGDFSLGVQPGGNDFTPGTIDIRVENKTNSYLSEIYLNGDLFVNNDQERGNSIDIYYSIDNVNFILLTGGTNYVSPGPSDGDGFQLAFSINKLIDLSSNPIEPSEFIYFRLESDDVSGSGARDEFSIDNILVEGI